MAVELRPNLKEEVIDAAFLPVCPELGEGQMRFLKI
jgi:hypothetical protein